MTPRFRLALVAGVIALTGCSDSFNAGPIDYAPSPDLVKLNQEAKDSAGKPVLKDGKPVMEPKRELLNRVNKSMTDVFGPTPQEMVVPKGAGLPEGGARLADQARVGTDKTFGPVGWHQYGPDGKLKGDVLIEGGYSLYRKHCLHCHGVSGDGAGPTSAFLWPRPRDYRRGIFKFTSTTGQKPTREDLARIVNHGIGNSSMPAFEALMDQREVQQVIDYVIFLSARGETERRLIEEASTEDEPKDAKAESPINKEKAEEIAQSVFDLWKTAETEVLNPPVPRTPSTRQSIANGKTLFLGLGTPKLECAGCHGPRAKGDGQSFVPYDMFREVVFGGDPAMQDTRLEEVIEREAERAVEDAEPELAEIKSPGEREKKAEEIKKAKAESVRQLWVKGSLDDWGNPLRPANINNGPTTQYKGGRRPIDLYWRIAKGINGAKMPAHAQLLKPEQIWDLVNFVLALPYQPNLLNDAPDTIPAATSTPAVTASASSK
ncbi:MAG: Cytochrome c [Planctomycetota bacterium]|nr:Cytochrome c [Planctomycetota bacterium]